jgi:parallel beta-helix repeat protein
MITDNEICRNARSGITCCGASYPHIAKNEINGHTQSGINLRDNSRGNIYDNQITKNFYNLSTRAYSKAENQFLLAVNEIDGENEFSANCAIF